MDTYPAQASLMPIQIALTRFLETNGLSALVSDYPYWYLGTTPYYYLTGPIIPLFTGFLHGLVPDLSLFTIMFGLIGVFWLVGGVGVYFLVRELKGEGRRAEGESRILAVTVSLFYLAGPIVPFLFRFTDGVYLIAFSFLPFTLLKYLKLLKHWSRKDAVITGLLISFLILLNSLIIPALVIGMVSLLLAHGDWDNIESKIKKSILLFTFSILISTIWYTPGYWVTLLGAPSLAGEGLFKVIASLGKLIPVSLALAAAVFSIRIFKKREILRDFAFYWFFIFGFLSLLRFLSDPDFWLDWSAYGLEIQFGMAIIMALMLGKIKDRRRKTDDGLLITENRGQKADDRLQKTDDRGQANENQFSAFSFQPLFSVFSLRFSLMVIYFLIFSFVFNKYVLRTLQKDITKTVEYKISKQLEQVASSGERVLLSGSTVFWLNAFVDVPQVRGGVDQASKDGSWRKEVWEIREGEDGQKSLAALRKLGVKYLVVHTQDSSEYYHDFKYPYKFENLAGLEKIFEESGDVIYRIED